MHCMFMKANLKTFTHFLLPVSKMGNLLFWHIFISSLIFFSTIKLSLAADTITPATSIRDGEKLVSLSQRFELGFFSPGKSKYRYLGIWYQQIPETAVWVANRDRPIFDRNAVLTITSDGNLVLLNQTNGTIWSSNSMSTKAGNPVAQLLDVGNFVIRDNSSRNNNSDNSYLWQSFDYPSNTLLQGMKMGWDLKHGLERYLMSWESDDDPSQGNFTLRLDIQLLPKLCIHKGSTSYACSGPWNGAAFGGFSSNTSYLYQPTLVQNEDEVYYKYDSYSNPIVMILRLNSLGHAQRLIWHDMKWQVFTSPPNTSCEISGHCAPNSVCFFNQTPSCNCLEGFELKSQYNNQTWPRTCVRSHSLDCESGSRFIKLEDVKLPDFNEASLNQSMNLKECETACLQNCSCKAYSHFNITGGNGCLMWFGDLLNIMVTKRNSNGATIYIRVPASEPGNKKLLWIVVIGVLPLVLLSLYFLHRRRKQYKEEKETETMETNQDLLQFDLSLGITTRSNEFGEGDREAEGKRKDSLLPLFSLASVSAATEAFSMQSKLGEGGFGPVYRGRLLNGQDVAIKRLSSRSGQGLKEFKNEIMLIAKLQHRNLVRLLGCCIEQKEKILIYEYMPNRSLDVFLFDPAKKHLLGWLARVRIIEGIAQGLLYLHQYSRLRIIHRDLKASNILLDSDMNPKISDFGMARMFGGNELQGNTNRIVGTYGYMSPEYALDGLFSIKSDVFSFGVLMLETLSNKKNTGIYNNDCFNLLGHAWNLWKCDRAHELMDPVVQDEASYPTLMRYINVALLCVQENAADRPTMSDVVSMLSNELFNLASPKEPAFSKGRNVKNSSQPNTSTSEDCSVNDVTISSISPR